MAEAEAVESGGDGADTLVEFFEETGVFGRLG